MPKPSNDPKVIATAFQLAICTVAEDYDLDDLRYEADTDPDLEDLDEDADTQRLLDEARIDWCDLLLTLLRLGDVKEVAERLKEYRNELIRGL